VSPAALLALVVGVASAAFYVVLRGRVGRQLGFVVVAAVLGAWAGDAVGRLLRIDLFRIGDFRLVSALALAWLAVGFVTLLAILGPEERESHRR
jgi:ABC-type spermidine/putrescine transport system permease subunit I